MNRTILLTGGTGKFGKVMLRYFTDRNWDVVVTSRDPQRLQQLLAEPRPGAGAAHGIVADHRVADSAGELAQALADRGIVVSHLINNARALGSLAVQADGTTRRQDFLEEFELDVVAPYELTLAFAKAQLHRLQAVVNIGSQYGLVAPNPALYCGSLDRSPVQYGVSKAALHHLTRELAVRLAAQGIRVNTVAFGGVEGRVDGAFLDRYAALTPARRMLTEAEIPGPVEFLLDEASAAVNGHVLVADGGWSLW